MLLFSYLSAHVLMIFSKLFKVKDDLFPAVIESREPRIPVGPFVAPEPQSPFGDVVSFRNLFEGYDGWHTGAFRDQ